MREKVVVAVAAKVDGSAGRFSWWRVGEVSR